MQLLIAGDFIPLKGDCDAPWCDRLSEQDAARMRGHDVLYLNLETPLTRQGEQVQKVGPTLGGDPASVALLKKIGVNVVNLANNHINDFGRPGIQATVDLLRDSDIGWFGAGTDSGQASRHFVRDYRGIKVGFAGFAEEHYGNAAGGEVVVCPLSRGAVISAVRKLRSECDIAIVAINHGLEWVPWPSPALRSICREAIDNGASVVVTHQPHLPRGFEAHGNGLIVYGAGSFYTPHFDSWHGRAEFDWGLLFCLDISADGVKIAGLDAIEIGRDGRLALRALKSNVGRERHLYLCNAPLNGACALDAIWQEVSVRLYEREYGNWLGWNERDRIYPLKEWGKRLLLLWSSNGQEAQQRLKQRYMRRWELLRAHSSREVIVTALDVLSGHAKDLRSPKSERLVREMMPWLFR